MFSHFLKINNKNEVVQRTVSNCKFLMNRRNQYQQSLKKIQISSIGSANAIDLFVSKFNIVNISKPCTNSQGINRVKCHLSKVSTTSNYHAKLYFSRYFQQILFQQIYKIDILQVCDSYHILNGPILTYFPKFCPTADLKFTFSS